MSEDHRWKRWISRLVAPPIDPELDKFRDAVGVLRLDGVVAGHLVTRVETFWGLGRPFGLQECMWLYFRWVDGPASDPKDERHWELDEPPWAFRDDLERDVFYDDDEDDTAYDIEWLTGDERHQARQALGFTVDG